MSDDLLHSILSSAAVDDLAAIIAFTARQIIDMASLRAILESMHSVSFIPSMPDYIIYSTCSHAALHYLISLPSLLTATNNHFTLPVKERFKR